MTNSFLIKPIVSKFQGKALMIVGSRLDLRRLEDLKQLLGFSFCDQTKFRLFISEMAILKPYQNKTTSIKQFKDAEVLLHLK